MPKKIADHAVMVGALEGRNTESKLIPPNTPFDFTEGEIADIIRHQGEDSLRDPVNEDPGAPAAAPKAEKPATKGKGEEL